MGGSLFTLLYCSIILVNAEFFVVTDEYYWHFLLPLHYTCGQSAEWALLIQYTKRHEVSVDKCQLKY